MKVSESQGGSVTMPFLDNMEHPYLLFHLKKALASIVMMRCGIPRASKLVLQCSHNHKHVSKAPVALKSLIRTNNHQRFSDHLQNNSVPLVIGIGPAGCGKTLLSCAHAVSELLQNRTRRIVITRPTVSSDEQLGFLPGSMEDKMLPWLMPIYDCFKEVVSVQQLKEFVVNGEIEVCPLSYMRGRSFHDCWVIADEIQNSTVGQVKTLLTRVGQRSKIVLTGDLDQCDLNVPNGLADFIERQKAYEKERGPGEVTDCDTSVKIVEFDHGDIMRSSFVKHVLDIYRV